MNRLQPTIGSRHDLDYIPLIIHAGDHSRSIILTDQYKRSVQQGWGTLETYLLPGFYRVAFGNSHNPHRKFILWAERTIEEAEEFWPHEGWQSPYGRKTCWKFPRPTLGEWACCLLRGHLWRKYLGDGILRSGDCDVCSRCHKMKGPHFVTRCTKRYTGKCQ